MYYVLCIDTKRKKKTTWKIALRIYYNSAYECAFLILVFIHIYYIYRNKWKISNSNRMELKVKIQETLRKLFQK